MAKPKQGIANIKLCSATIKELKKLTQQATGQRAVEKAVTYFIREARQRDLLKFLTGDRFLANFDPAELRTNDR